MSLTRGNGPLSYRPGKYNFEWNPPRGHILYLEDVPRRVRAIFNGETVADSRRMKLLHETGLLPTYYFPQEDVRTDLLIPTDHATHCPFKGDASYWSVRVGERTAENAVWGYPVPLDTAPPISGLVAFYWDAMDAWYEEDEQVFVHPRDPYTRVDVLKSSRHVRVFVGGGLVAETRRPKVLFETSLPPRYYVPREDVKTSLFFPSGTETRCPYKGVADHFSFENDGRSVEDVAWSYPNPLPEAYEVADHLCFYTDKATVEVDGEQVE
jgi:uncharacterized protein (DUF427 family)